MGALDPHIQGADRVREVFARVGRGDPGAADLYAEDGVITYAGGGRVEGRAAIRAFYEQMIGTLHPQPHVQAVLEAPPLYVVVLDVPTEATVYRAVDLFEVDDTGIRRLEIYTQT